MERVDSRWSGSEREALLGGDPLSKAAGDLLSKAAGDLLSKAAGDLRSRAAGDLLATKLHVPRAQPGFVPRPRLARRLDEGLARGVILVSAPAGSGKTSLVADWVRASDRPVAWLSLDAGDNDPARFWRHAFAALDRARPGIGSRVAPLLRPSERPSSEVLVTILINEMASHEAVFVLDDYHVIDSRQLHDGVAFLVSNLPAGLRLVLASRNEPPLPLARLRARGQVTEVIAADLRFTVAEAAALLGGTVSGDTVAALTDRTEGWAAGLQLAALSLRGQQDPVRFLAEFSGTNRYVLDYLTEEVLDAQATDVRGFLLQTSVLDRLSGPLCDALTGRSDSQRMLELIERAGLFLIPLDGVRGWWRYHHLFADLLRHRIDAEQPGRASELHAIAAQWHEEHGLADDAIRHALAAGLVDETARLIERHFDAAYMTGERATIQRWLSAVPASVALARPRLRLAQTLAALVYGDVERAAALLDGFQDSPAAARSGSTGAPPGGSPSALPSRSAAEPAEPGFVPSAGAAASLLVNLPAGFAIGHAWLAYLRGELDAMAEFAHQARASLAPGQLLLESIYQLNLALADWLRGNLTNAEREFTELVARWQSLGEDSLAARSCRFLGEVQRDRGRLDAAAATYGRLVEIAEDAYGPRPPVAAYGLVGLAEDAYERDSLDEALRYATEGIARSRQLSENEPLASGLVVLARIRQAEGDRAGAVAAMAEAERSTPSPATANLLAPIAAQRARLLLTQGDLAAVAEWAGQRGLFADDEPSYLGEQEHLVLARLLLAQGRPDRALPMLDRMQGLALAQERVGNVIQLLALRALATAAAGDRVNAAILLGEALSRASSRGYVRVFADEGPAMTALLAETDTDGVPAEYLARVRRACAVTSNGAANGRRRAATPGLIDPLTTRELEVLTLLAAGGSNQGIADELVVTVDTVKKHITHVLAKLGAANRTQAVARARQLGLLS
jgi:LuxR family maltose regulon positive regulatory protein